MNREQTHRLGTTLPHFLFNLFHEKCSDLSVLKTLSQVLF